MKNHIDDEEIVRPDPDPDCQVSSSMLPPVTTTTTTTTTTNNNNLGFHYHYHRDPPGRASTSTSTNSFGRGGRNSSNSNTAFIHSNGIENNDSCCDVDNEVDMMMMDDEEKDDSANYSMNLLNSDSDSEDCNVDNDGDDNHSMNLLESDDDGDSEDDEEDDDDDENKPTISDAFEIRGTTTTTINNTNRSHSNRNARTNEVIDLSNDIELPSNTTTTTMNRRRILRNNTIHASMIVDMTGGDNNDPNTNTNNNINSNNDGNSNHNNSGSNITEDDNDKKLPARTTTTANHNTNHMSTNNLNSNDNDDNDNTTNNQWSCPRCTLLNPCTETVCNACQYRNPTIVVPQQFHTPERQQRGYRGSALPSSLPSSSSSPLGYIGSGAILGAAVGAAGNWMQGRNLLSGAFEGGTTGAVGGAFLHEVLNDTNGSSNNTGDGDDISFSSSSLSSTAATAGRNYRTTTTFEPTIQHYQQRQQQLEQHPGVFDVASARSSAALGIAGYPTMNNVTNLDTVPNSNHHHYHHHHHSNIAATSGTTSGPHRERQRQRPRASYRTVQTIDENGNTVTVISGGDSTTRVTRRSSRSNGGEGGGEGGGDGNNFSFSFGSHTTTTRPGAASSSSSINSHGPTPNRNSTSNRSRPRPRRDSNQLMDLLVHQRLQSLATNRHRPPAAAAAASSSSSRRNNTSGRLSEMDGYEHLMNQYNLNNILQQGLFGGNNQHRDVDTMNYEQLLTAFGDGTENLGADEHHIQQLPTHQISENDALPEDARQCLICLEEFTKGASRTILPCLHGFHTECCTKWLRTNGSCPICKHKIG